MSESTALPVRPGAVSAVNGGASLSVRQANPAVAAAPPWIGVWSRVLVMLLLLVGLKLLLIVGQGKNLYEAHWRVSGADFTWLNYVLFCGFVALGGLSLFRLESEVRSRGIKSVRITNAVVLALGLSFVFLTFHNGNKNFLYPIVSKVLKWDSLGPYAANSLFFNQPFLAAWLFVYSALYYVLTRTGRECRVLFLTALFACAYALINLRDMTVQGDELLIIDCLGVVSLTVPLVVRNRVSPGWAWVLAPLVWIVVFCWNLLRFDTQWHSYAATYFLGLIFLTLLLFAGGTFLVRQSGKSPTWTWSLPFFCAAFFLLSNTNYPSADNYDHLLCLALTFPRYFFGELILVALLALAAVVYRRFWPRAGLWWLDLAAIGLMVLIGIDLRLSQIMGVRLGCDVLSFGDSPKMMLRMAKPYLPAAILGLLIIVAAYALAVRGLGCLVLSRRGPGDTVKPNRQPLTQLRLLTSVATRALPVLFVCLALLGVATAESDKVENQAVFHLVQTSPLWKRVSRRTLTPRQFLESAKSLGLGDLSGSSGSVPTQPPRDLNVLLVFMESSYNKHLSLFGSGEQTQPMLSKYKEQMELFPNFFSAFAGSIHARFATFTSLYPVQDFHAFTQERVPVKSLFEVLHDHGYSCSMFYSSYFDYTGFRDFLKNRGVDEMYDADSMPGQRTTERVEWGLLEGETLDAIRAQIKKYAQTRQRFCLTYVPAAPHNPYDKIPKAFRQHKMVEIDDFTPLYLNELLYMDWVIASILDELKQSGLLDHTLVVITNDHGEMLGGKDSHIGHGWALTPELANTPLIFMDPQRPGLQINKTIGTQVDLLPTILSRLNIPLPSEQLYEGVSLDAGPARQGRVSYLNTYRQFGIISGDQLELGDRESSAPGGLAFTAPVFTITNEGPKTIFTQSSQPAHGQESKAAMARFDVFQENLLRNYEIYCAAVRGSAQQQAKRAQ